KPAVAAIEEGVARRIVGTESTYALALSAIERGRTLEKEIRERGFGEAVDLEELAGEGRLLAPLTHPDPAHLHITGTGLTHLGSASARDAMHRSEQAEQEGALTDSMKMFRMGLEGGKPEKGET